MIHDEWYNSNVYFYFSTFSFFAQKTSDTQDDSGVFATNSQQHEAIDESISYLNMQTVQVSPVLSSITDTSSSTRGERHHSTSSSYKTQSKTSPYIAPINPAGLTTGRDRSTSFDKHRNPMNNNQGGRDRNNLGDRNRHGRGDPNIIHQQYHNPQLQSQQQNYYNMNRQRSGNQQGVGGGMNNNPQLQSQQPNMQQQYFEIPQYMHGNMIYGNVLPQQPQQLMQQHNLAHQIAQHQQFVDPRISQYMAGMSIAAPGHTAFYLNQNNRYWDTSLLISMPIIVVDLFTEESSIHMRKMVWAFPLLSILMECRRSISSV